MQPQASSRSERALLLIDATYIVSIVVLLCIPANTDTDGTLSTATEWSNLGLLLAIPVTALLALAHVPHVMRNRRLPATARGLWVVAMFGALPAAAPLYWLRHFAARGKPNGVS